MENVPGLGHTNGARIVVEVEPPQTTTLLMISQAKPINKKYILTRKKKNRRKNQNKKIRSSPFLSGLNTVVSGHIF